MSLSATILTKIGIVLTNPLDLTTPRSELEQRYSQSYADGTGAGQANASFSDRRNVNATTTDSLDLAGGVSSPLTGTMTFTALKEVFIKSADANTTNLLIG